MASIFDNGPSGVNLPDLRQWPQQTWGAGPSSMRQTEPSDYPGYGRRIPTPARKPGLQDDIYQGVEESFNPIGADQAVDVLQVRPTEFAKELLEYRAINGITPEKDRDTIEAWNRYKKEQYQRRGQGGWEQPQDTPPWYGESAYAQVPDINQGNDLQWAGAPGYDTEGYSPETAKVSEFALQSSELVNPRAIMAEARAMEDQGSAEGIELTQQPDVGEASVVQLPKFRGNY